MKNNNKKFTTLVLSMSVIFGVILSNGVYANQDLTTNKAEKISVSAENIPNEGKTRVFDNDQYSKWLTFNSTGWVSYNFDRMVDISEYTVTSANDAQTRDPKKWILQGSIDGVNWFEIDTRNEESFDSRNEKKTYTLTNPQLLIQIRFNVTKNNGADLLQIAELEFIGKDSNTGEALPLVDNSSLNIKQWQHYGPFSSNRNIIANTTGNGDNDLYMRKGAESTTKYYDCKSISPSSTEECKLTGNNLYVSVHGYTAVDYSLNIKEESDGNNGGDNSSWTAPQVDFIDMNPETQGSQLVNRILGNPSQHMAQRCIDVAKVLYTDPSESSRFHSLRFELRAKDFAGNDFVAYKVGTDGSGEMTIAVSTSHLENLYRDGGNSDSAIQDEIDGILFHELTHGYNNSPLTTDQYGNGGPFWAYTEGIADAVRIGAGFHKTRQPDVNNPRKWLGGYTTSGFFLHYVSEKIDPEFLLKFNQSAKDLGDYSWSWDNAFKSITNRGVQDVWDEYKTFIDNGGELNY
jgi:hypothetical protein